MAVEHHPRNGSRASLGFLKLPQTGIEWLAAGFFTVLWSSALLTYGAGYFGWFADSASARTATLVEVMLYLCALVLPIGVAWVGAFFVSQTMSIRQDARQLRYAVNDLNNAIKRNDSTLARAVPGSASAQAKTAPLDEALKSEQKRMSNQMRIMTSAQQEIATSVQKLVAQTGAEKQEIHKLVETAQDVAEKATRKVAAVDKANRNSKPAPEADLDALNQAALPLGGEDDLQSQPAQAPEWNDLNRALNFPRDEADEDGFAAIRRVLPYRCTAQLLQSAEDVLSMLAQEGIYMDDLQSSPANPDLWRKFAQGARGEVIADMGTIEDQAAIALVKGRMRTDEKFQDRGLEFLRLFDRMLAEFEHESTDRDLATLAGTRSGLAFQLMARANGAFS